MNKEIAEQYIKTRFLSALSELEPYNHRSVSQTSFIIGRLLELRGLADVYGFGELRTEIKAMAIKLGYGGTP